MARSKKETTATFSGDAFASILGSLGGKNIGASLLSEGTFRSEPSGYLSTGVAELDHYVLGSGGLPWGRISEMYGPPGCLSGETRVNYCVVSPAGRKQNSKGGSLKRLYHRFHNIPYGDKGSYQREQTVNAHFTLPSIDGNGRVFHNRILDVVHSGVKPCLKLSAGSRSIRATKDHLFWNGSEFVSAGELTVGSIVHIHNNTFDPPPRKPRPRRVDIFVKSHPHACIKTIIDRKTKASYSYYRVRRARAVVEAYQSGLALHEYVNKLNKGDHEGIVFLDPALEVHHKDHVADNDVPENLVVLSSEEHSRLHMTERCYDYRYVSIPVEITSIEEVGDLDTYDVCMEGPNHNFVADGFVVHNSGKSSLVYSCVKQAQLAGAIPVLIHTEEKAQKSRLVDTFHVDPSKLILLEPETMEEVVSAIESVIVPLLNDPSKPHVFIAWDSLAATRVNSEDKMASKEAPAERARLMGHAMRLLPHLVAKSQAHLMIVNQNRQKIGVMFGSNKTQPGGNAPKYHATVRLECSYTGKVGGADNPTGIEVQFKADKNQSAAPFRKVTSRLDFEKGWDTWGTTYLAKKMKLIGARGTYEQAIEALTACNWGRSASQTLTDEPEELEALSNESQDD